MSDRRARETSHQAKRTSGRTATGRQTHAQRVEERHGVNSGRPSRGAPFACPDRSWPPYRPPAGTAEWAATREAAARSASTTATSAGCSSEPRRQAMNRCREGGSPAIGRIATPGGGSSCARRGTHATPRPGADERHHRGPVRGPVRDRGREPGGGAAHADHVLARPAARRCHERFGRERREWDRRLACQPVILRQRDVEQVAHQRDSGKALVVVPRCRVGLHRDPQVEFAAREQVEHLGALELLHRQLDSRRPLAYQPDRGHDEADDPGRERPDPDATPLAAGERGERGVHPLEFAEHRVGVAEDGFGRGGQPDRPPVGDQQRLSHLLLERRELLRDRRRRQIQRIGRRGDRAAVRELPKGTQPAKVDHEEQLTSSVKKV